VEKKMNKQTAPPTLDQRIISALDGNVDGDVVGSQYLMELIADVEAAVATAAQNAEAERTKAIDIVQSPNAEAAQRAVAETILARERLRASLKKMRAKLSEALAAEAQERWLVEFNCVKQKRDEAAATFRRYPELSLEILHLFALAAEIDREIDHVNANAPNGVHQRLRHVENEARNVEFSRDRPSLAATVELRDWDNSGRMLWPQRHFGSLAAAFAQSMTMPAAGGRWGEPENQAERRREIERAQAQIADFYQQATERQEARQNAEARERIDAALPNRAG
jgi:hypothetical protein